MSGRRYKSALRYLYGFINYEQEPGASPARFNLDPIKALLHRLDHPERAWPSVHIAGTKGKGSTAAMIASILHHGGYRTGLYTSPHLVSWRERIAVDGKPISRTAVCRLVKRLRPVVATVSEALPGAPTFFDVWTALAFLYFAEKRVDIAVVEVGLGGRLDSTNVIMPAVSVITPVGLDHTDRLGHTLTAIAREKAGIIKNGVPTVCGPQTPEALAVIRETCRARRSPLHEVEREMRYTVRRADPGGQLFDLEGRRLYPDLEMSLLGVYQVVNAATAVCAIEALNRCGFTVTPQNVEKGLRWVRWPGRLQVVQERPWLVLDGAHNVLSAQTFVRTIREVFAFRRAVFVVSLHADKDVEGVCRILAALADHVIVARRRVLRRRQADPDQVAALLRDRRIPVTVAPTVKDALAQAMAMASSDDLIGVTGSFALVGEAVEVLQNLEPEETYSR